MTLGVIPLQLLPTGNRSSCKLPLVEVDSLSDTRERIREAGLKLFIERGYACYARPSIADIEKAAGLAPRAGGFHRHFPSKAALAAEVGEAR